MLIPLPMIASAGSLAAGAAGLYYATSAVRSQWLGATDWRGRTDTASVSLTFDDGPSEDTERILDVLSAYKVRATFFMLGRQVELFPEIAQRIVADGHEVGNHSYSHPLYLFRRPGETRQQLERAQEIIASVTGTEPRFARPPYGVRTPAYFAATRRLGLRTVQWDVAGFDWKKRTASQIAERVLREATGGSIILLHDADSAEKRDRSATVAALPMVIEGLRARGLGVVPLSKLLEPRRERRIGRRNGFGKRRPERQKPIVFLDFDGTITLRDAVDAILEAFADPRWLAIEEDWRSGRIGSRECLAEQMRLVRATKDQINALLDSVDVDEGLVTLLQTCAAHQVEAHIISDGFDYCIDRILARPSLDLKSILHGVRILSSHMEPTADRWRVDFPSFHQSCGHGCATCKPAMMSLLNRANAPTIFVGDGLSDKYAAASADFVFAKDGLAAYCEEQQIAHARYSNLTNV
ncbi:MAG TPA: MtnX-like HAD-IB family phosphatase, partial [Pyrinomonadaceae bacterium]|nr:MtnX-like HAD-IB family phosphatase [Pyrinomonadaceae bacterium]